MARKPRYSATREAILAGRTYAEFASTEIGATVSLQSWYAARNYLRSCGYDVSDGRMRKQPRVTSSNEAAQERWDAPGEPDVPEVYSDKKVGETNWREWASESIKMQQLAKKSSSSQDFSKVSIPDQQGPLLILPFSDSHLGAWSTNLELFMQMTDEILSLGPARCRILLLGDLVEMAIKMRSVGEVTNQMWTPEMQANVLESWLQEIAPMVLAATWCNHAVEREEKMSGLSTFKRMLYKYFIYHDGIGHMDLTVGSETYKLALSHRFGGHSIYNKTHGPNRYFKFEGSDREVACQGDIHTPALSEYYDGPNKRLAVTAGTLHTDSLYARRHFSLFTIPDFPCFLLYPDTHLIVPYWSVSAWATATGYEPPTPSPELALVA